ncbi:hypothetical protein NUW54_g6873 [Trametes sanguinea]|uniref:Uncharacterized protein n=1 Tax=Trametes sanguinea TaxID=158606 RepID=A0ACC1PT38_9APHY|nr:hypothetical protein NUW54_g6873 [Trametes sanguinea]
MRSTWYIFEQFTKRTSLHHHHHHHLPGHSPPASLKVNIAKEHPQFKGKIHTNQKTQSLQLGSDLQHSQEETGKKRNNSLVAKTKGKEEGDQTDQVDQENPEAEEDPGEEDPADQADQAGQENQAMEEKDPKETDQAPAKTTLRDHKKA